MAGKRHKNIAGHKFGRLEAVEYDHTDNRGHAYWKCHCDCGNYCIVSSRDLVTGHTKSCGCLKREVSSSLMRKLGKEYGKITGKENLKKVNRNRKGINSHHYKHGLRHTRIYQVWTDMKRRCYNPNSADYKYYGERGITVCNEWKEDAGKFADWAFSHGYDKNAPKGTCTLDRIDVNGNYEPDNCRWITLAEQQRNKRNSKKA